jgi:uncharacterized delta-60 repeat protein
MHSLTLLNRHNIGRQNRMIAAPPCGFLGKGNSNKFMNTERKQSCMRTTSKAALLLFSVTVLLTGAASPVRGQSALDGFDPNANGVVRATVVQPDGKILIGGEFTTVLGVARNRIARLNPDGTLDTAFNPNANGFVNAIALQADGKILVGGSFNGANSIGGQARNGIARLEGVTGSADAFDPNANNAVETIAVQADGKILLGGEFTTLSPNGGAPVTRNYIARLNAAGTLDNAFNPNANNVVYAIAIQPDGKILAGGGFTSIGGKPRNCIARLDVTTGAADSFDPNANNFVVSLAVQADGKILVGGGFTSIGGQARNRMARLDATGGADSFNPNASDTVYSIAVQADGRILAAGIFTTIGGQTRFNIARLNPATGSADSFNPNTNAYVLSVAVQADGKILAGGGFTTLAPNGGAVVTRNNIARLETDGRLDRTLNLGIVGSYVLATAVQPDGKILIGGLFTSVLGAPRRNIARLNTDGTLDTVFNPIANDQVYAIAVQADGRILVGGKFTSIGGATRNYIARLEATGMADSFNPNANTTVYAIAVQADGKILVGGAFISIGGAARNRIARLDATGFADSFNPNANSNVFSIAVQADGRILAGGDFISIGGAARNYIARLDASAMADSFNPNANDFVYAIAIQPDGRILAGGNFTSVGGAARNGIARLDATGIADSFNPNANSSVLSIAVQADGKILAGGEFTSIDGLTRNRIARLDATTGAADSFNPNANNTVFAIVVQAGGKVLVGGAFANIGGQVRNFLARLSNDNTAALQNLTVSQTTITWARAGSSPQLSRITFEYSTDNVNYTFLGNGSTSGSNWTLTGLSLPSGQNIYVRARGYYRSGYFNGSESITESVRNAFLVPIIQDKHAYVQYDGWRGFSSANANGGYYRMSKIANETITYPFTGTSIKWITRKGANMGKALVTVDGVNAGTFDLYNSSALWNQQILFSGLATGSHTLVIKVTGTRNANATDFNVALDGFLVGSSTTPVQESAVAVQYNNWKGKNQNAASGGSFRSNGTLGAAALFRFNGPSITFITARGPSYGKVNVLIDGVVKSSNLDLYAASQQWQYGIQYSGLANANHTIEVRPTHTKNASSTGYNVVVDAFSGWFTALP